jgi:hypothetical protein
MQAQKVTTIKLKLIKSYDLANTIGFGSLQAKRDSLSYYVGIHS